MGKLDAFKIRATQRPLSEHSVKTKTSYVTATLRK